MQGHRAGRLLVTCAVLLGGCANHPSDYWPTREWKTSTPEEQGMDSARLAQMYDRIGRESIGVDSVMVIRHGRIVSETYFGASRVDTHHPIYSITKSVISTLVGIAIQQGRLRGVDERVLGFFPDVKVENLDAGKEALTVEHLLTMTSGIDWGNEQNQLDPQTHDVARVALGLPLVADPGTRWRYSSCDPDILSAVVRGTTGMSALAYAEANLLRPLGITDVTWSADAAGNNLGASGMSMRPRDLAKLGHLYLSGGLWDGKQLVPAEYVRTATETHVQTTDGRGYGYLWWRLPFGYAALGSGGQQIIVIPEHQLEVVFTAHVPDEKLLWKLVEDFVIPAIQGTPTQ